MRTSRPAKHAPRPLLPTTGGKGKGNKGKGKEKERESEDGQKESSYSFTQSTSKGKGTRRAERRIIDSRQAIKSGNERGQPRNGGKRGKAAADGDEQDDDDEENEFGNDIDHSMDISNIKFRLGVGSDDEEGANGLAEDDEDEEIDSDLADTDSEEEDRKSSKTKKNVKSAKASSSSKPGRAVATDFYNVEPPEIDLNEDSEADEDEELSEDGYMDISEMLGSSEPTSSRKSKFEAVAQPDDVSEEDDEDEEDEEGDEEDEVSDGSADDDEGSLMGSLDEDEEDPEALSRLGAMVNGLSAQAGTKRRNEDDQGSTITEIVKKRKKNALGTERTEAIPEGEFAATSSNKDGKLTLESMLATLSGPQQAALKKSLRPLTSTRENLDDSDALAYEHARLSSAENDLLARERSKADAANSRNPLKAAGALPAPLAPLHQAKVERLAAKERMGTEVKKWDETVKAMRGISTKDGADDPEQRLVLPLRSEGEGKGTTGAELVAKFNPQNDMERKMADLIASTGMSSNGLMATESSALMDALPANSSEKSAAHDAKRTAQLRLARDLMFRAERKAKRIAKIKSRTFRKIAKKSRARALAKGGDGEEELTFEEMAELDALDGGDRAEQERERLETLRAQERATLRHASGGASSGGGRWAKGLKGMEGMNDDLRDAMRTRESKQALLRRKILGNDDEANDEDRDDVHSGSDSEDDERDESGIKASAYDELAQLRSSTARNGSKEIPKGLMGMKFMQKALANQDAQVDKMVDDFAMQVGDENADDRAEYEDNVRNGGELVKGNPGRMVFGPAPGSTVDSQPSAVVNGQDSKTDNRKGKKKGHSARTGGEIAVNNHEPSSSVATLTDYNPFAKLSSMQVDRPGATEGVAEKEVNPWLAHDTTGSLTVSRKANAAQDVEKATSKLQKQQGRSKEALRKVRDDARVDIDLDKILTSAQPELGRISPPTEQAPSSPPEKNARKQSREMAPPPSSSAAPRIKPKSGKKPSTANSDNDEDDEDDLPEALKKKQGPQAFKQRDLVARAFAGDDVVADFEAMKAAEIAADAPHEEDLTLPGWGAWGGKGVKKNKSNTRKVVKKHGGIEADQRKDAKLKHVVISERTDKKAQKYLTKDLPYPYTSKAQYEQKLAQPTGVEWSTRGTYKEATKPKVLIKPGQVIKPVSKQV